MFKFKLFLFVVTISGHGIDFGGTSGYTDLSNFTTAYKGKVSSGGGHNLRLIEEEDELWNNRTSRHLFNFLGSHRHEVAECGFKCNDGSCIKSYMKCDGKVQCPDVSDELDCKCSERIPSKKLCDNFEDCPMGEDEMNCGFGCDEDEFSCSTTKGSSTCVKISKRCDGKKDCPGQEDENGCFRLTGFDFTIRGILPGGALQKKIGGDWYTICKSSGRSEERWLKKYAKKACEYIVGQVSEDPKTALISTNSLNINAEYLAVEPLIFAKFGESESQFSVLSKCSSGKIYQIQCPDPECGWPISKYEPRSVHHSQNTFDSDHYRYRRHTASEHLTAKIVGGYDSVHGDWPFIVGIYRNGSFHCGGSIVNNQYIITAAHCCHGYDKYVFEIQVGMTRRNSWSPHEQTRVVTEIHVHERYDSKIFLNDIAMMKVDFPFYLSKWVTTACLATEKSHDPGAETNCKVIGWGDISEEGDGPDHLQEVELPILAKCQETFTKDSHQICAGVMEGGKDACQGDSGGPLICYDGEGRPYLNGLVSFGRGCARPNQAGVYTRVSAYKSWIESIVSGENPSMKQHKHPKECTAANRCLRDGGECLFKKFYCDQEVECLGVDDESSCQYVSRAAEDDDDEPGEDAYEHIRRTSHDTQEHTHEYGTAKLCGPTEFQCKTTLSCIPLEDKCNGRFECSDGTDEKQCECGEVIQNAFPSQKCDGIQNCLDGSDELDCERCNGTRGVVKCPFSDKCISESHVCDGMSHCDFGEDEIDCIRITKTKGKIPAEGFLSDKVSRGLHGGYVVIRSSGITWRLACAEDFGTGLKDIVCPYLGLATPEVEVTRSARKTGHYDPKEMTPRTSRNVDKCQQVKVQCGEPSCGESKLFSMSDKRPNVDHLGALPWLTIVLVEGIPICAATLVHKQWLLVRSDCIDENVRSITNEYVSAVAGFSEITNIVASPMEQIRRVNANVKLENGLTLLRLETAFMTDHFANPICTSVSSELDRSTCIRVSVVNGTGIKSWPISADPTCETELQPCVKGDGENCEDTAGSVVYCTTDGTSWFLLGFVDSEASAKKCLDKSRMELINPFFGSHEQETKNLLTRPPSSLFKAPGCSGTRCTYGNCVGKSYVCDGIAHCPDYLDEKRCQRHYQVLRTHDDDDVQNDLVDCPVGHFRCVTTRNCVPISAFCDGIFDCGEDDLTDEPLNEEDCSCRHYLELSAPDRVCDVNGTEHCPDRGDELGCPCRPDSFICDVSSANSSECIHKNLVCDSVKDCSNGRDEALCTAVSKSLDTIEVESKPGGTLEGYVLVRVKGSWHPYCTDQWSEDLGWKICKFLGYKTLLNIQTVGLDELKLKNGVRPFGVESQVQGQQTLLVLGKGQEFNTAGSIHEVVAEITSDEDDYQCELAYISCSYK